MNKLLIALFLFMIIGNVSAKSIEFDYPDDVNYNSEFEVTLKLIDFEDVSYDVKIDITKDGSRVSKVLVDELWKSTFYYVKDSITDESKFNMKISENIIGTADIIVRIRRSGTSESKLFGGYEINIRDSEDAYGEDQKDEDELEIGEEDSGKKDEDEEEEDDSKNEKVSSDDKDSKDPIDIEPIKKTKETPKNNSPIKIEFFESKDIKTKVSTNFHKNILGLGGIFMISIFLGFVYIRKQGKYKNEFR